jgi:hypothetical protein
MGTIITAMLSGSFTIVIIIVYIMFFPEKFEKNIAFFSKILSKMFFKTSLFFKNTIKYDVQGHINSYVKKVSKKIPELKKYKCKLEWMDPNTERQAFLEGDEVIIRLREKDTTNENFIHAAFLFVSKCLLLKVKRYLSPNQRDSLDTFVTADIIKNEKESIFDTFEENYLHKKINNEKKNKLFGKYQNMNSHALFYPVLIQEMNHLGKKVFGSTSKNLFTEEFDKLVEFLDDTSNRKIGEEMNLNFIGVYSRMIIVIIGKQHNIDNLDVYTDFIDSQIVKHNIDSIYTLGDIKNKEFINKVCYKYKDNFESVFVDISPTILEYSDGKKKSIMRYLEIIRRKEQDLSY